MTPAKIVSGILLWMSSAAACAHQLSTAYFTATLTDTGLMQGEWQVPLYDLDQAVGVDANRNGELLWGELLARREPVLAYLTDHLSVSRADSLCTFVIDENWQVTQHFNQGYLVLPVRVQCAIEGSITIEYSAFYAHDDEHKLLVSLSSAEGDNREAGVTANRIMSPSQRSITIDELGTGSFLATLKEFTAQGAIHIWKGLDHILFLLSLLLTCVLSREQGRWIGKQNIRGILTSTTWIVTAFTLAHSITLTATALGWMNLPVRWVEAGIAVSVVVAALNNVVPFILRLGWLTFAFGLLHGMGFAGVLGELGLPADQKVLTVLSFNVGVELGQLVVVAVVMPLLIIFRNKEWYARYVLPVASLAIAVVAIRWVFERVQ